MTIDRGDEFLAGDIVAREYDNRCKRRGIVIAARKCAAKARRFAER